MFSNCSQQKSFLEAGRGIVLTVLGTHPQEIGRGIVLTLIALQSFYSQEAGRGLHSICKSTERPRTQQLCEFYCVLFSLPPVFEEIKIRFNRHTPHTHTL